MLSLANVPAGEHIMKLNNAKIKAAQLKNGQNRLKMTDGNGLHLLLLKSGKYWRLNYRYMGKHKTLAFGTYPLLSLKEAREKCIEAKKLLLQGIDPSVDKKKKKQDAFIQTQACTFQAIAEEWHQKQTKNWVPKTAQHRRSSLTKHIYPWLGDKKLHEIRAIDVLEICRRVERAGHNEQAHRIKMICSQVLRYGIAIGLISHDPTRDLNGALEPIKTKHHPCITEPQQVGALMRAIDAHQGTFVVHCALKLSPYVFLRPVELRTLEWNEVNFAQRIITIAPHKMKMRETHIIPLSEQSTKILKEIQELTADGKFVFPGARSSARPMSDAAINAALRKLGYDTKSEHCAHGFRGMASTLLHEQGYNTDVIERQLAHKEGNAIKAAYNHARHLPERIKMMQDWANYLDSLRDNLPTY